MYELPKHFDAHCFVGRSLYEIAFNANQVRLMFDSGLRIVVEGTMVLANAAIPSKSTDSPININPQNPDVQLLNLIEAQVESAWIDEKRFNLTLAFSNGRTLALIGGDPYECYKIQNGKEELIV